MKRNRNLLLLAVLMLPTVAFTQSANRVPGTVFRDCTDCPEMVVVPAGKFTIGSSESEKAWAASHGASPQSVADESPQHEVSLPSFGLGKYDVTRGEYAAFVRETGYSAGDGCHESSMPKASKQAGANWQNPGFSQSERDPVICVSWQDARAFVVWLNGKLRPAGSPSGEGPYRLPSESEWEYAARAGTTTRFWWGDDDTNAGTYAWYKGNSGGQTHPVGSKPANTFGVYDMVGNVWQWTEDCYAENYIHAPKDGSASEAGKDCLRVDRGGSWLYPAWLLRSATRERNPADYRDIIMGFRVARTVGAGGQQPQPAARVVGTAPTDVIYARAGQLVPAGDGARLNLYCTGTGSPAVVFDSGWEDWAPAWSVVQPQIAKFTRACSYDRAGAGFSDAGPMPRTSVRIADELYTALHNAGISGPYILVGSAFGGDNVRTFADRHMADVAGLVLVDADPSDVEPKAMWEEEHRGDKRIIAQLRDCRNAIAEHRPLPPLTGRPGQGERTCAQQFFRGLPEAAWSPELNAVLLELAQTKVAMYDAYLSEMEQTPRDEIYLRRHRRSLGSRPIRVLTSGNHAVGHLPAMPNLDPKHLEYERQVTLAQARWLTLSSNAKQIFAHHSSEYIQFDEPETVISAVREVYEQSRLVHPE
ncbi:MAG: SUMF1/EgtB/PvdO family nonheme iron enzyme [Terriglobales bacterium]